jgi:hypothetical protein
MNIEIFYHLYIPPDERRALSVWWIDDHVARLKSSGLINVAKVNMCITMPIYLDFGNFGKDLKAYINNRYPFINILDVRDTSEPTNIYEGQTLKFLYNRCLLDDDTIVLYTHSKGIGHPTIFNNCWREILDYYSVDQWKQCVDILQTTDTELIGVKDISKLTVSGNVWWAKSSYIKTLPEPIDSSKYSVEHKWPGTREYRWVFEDWISLNNPQTHHVANTKVYHYDTMRFVEDVIADTNR